MPQMIPVFYLDLDATPKAVSQIDMYTIDATEAFNNAPDRFFRTRETAEDALAALKPAKAKKAKDATEGEQSPASGEVVPVIPLSSQV